MKYISDRISFHRHDEYTTILISTKVEKWKEGLLFGWMVMWSLIGVLTIYLLLTGNYMTDQLENSNQSQMQLFLLVFLVFWGYYLYRIVKVYLWRKKGVEYFKVEKDQLIVKRAFGKIGTAHSYLFSNMGNVIMMERKDRSFAQVMQSAFWDIGNESLSFVCDGKEIIFGLQLDAIEAKKLKDFLISEINKQKKLRKK